MMSSSPDIPVYSDVMDGELTFGEWLDDRLRERQMTQTALAERIDVAPSTVNAWVNDVSPPRKRACRLIADALKVSRSEVLRRAGYEVTTASNPEATLSSIANSDTNQHVLLMAGKTSDFTPSDWALVDALIDQINENKRGAGNGVDSQ